MTIFWTALMIGMAGSFHCVGMCGPIALALPLKGKGAHSRLFGSLAYNTGRLLTYTLIGAVFGLMGAFFVFSGLQQGLSIAIGILIILIIFLPNWLQNKFSPTHYISRMIAHIKQPMQQLLATPSYLSRLLIGILNGLLPCGLVYLGIAGAIATGSAVQGSLFMLFFGLGTFPAMLAVTFLGKWMGAKARNRIRAAVPVFMLLLGVMFIIRGMGLDIPYLSPLLASPFSSIPICE